MYKLVILLLLLGSFSIYGQMPPHPDLIEKINSGLIDTPHVLKNLEKLRARGIDAPWRDESLGKLGADNLTSNNRQFGALAVPSGEWNVLALLVEFSDNASITTASYFDDMLFEQASGSMWDYFKDVSYGDLDIVTVTLPSSVDWITAPSTYEYYAGGDYGMGSYPQNARKLVEDVVELVDHLVDYSKYDNDNDGDVDALMIIHSGKGAESTGEVDDIWSHMWSTKNAPRLDGVWITRYCIQPEYFSNAGDMTIGVYCHEMGHLAFGLPDLYDTDYSSNGLGSWSLMSGGSWNGNSGDTPAFPDAYNHIQMGYVDPIIINTNALNQSINQVETTPEIYKLYPNNTPGDEYFLVENRQKVGYDSDLRQGGLHIYHVDEDVNSQNEDEWYPGNTSSGHYLVALEQADGNWDLEKNDWSDRGDVYPGNTDNRTFNYNSTPDSRKYNGADSEISIVNISNSQSVMTADFELFETLTLNSPNGGEGWIIEDDYNITWSSVKIDNITIEYSTNNGSNWMTIVSSYPASGQSYNWTVPNNASSECLVKISDADNGDPSDQSDDVFTIASDQVVFTISGNVIYNRTFFPVENASVSLYDGVNLINTTVSNVDGSYIFNNVLPGSYSLVTEKSEGWGGSLASDALEVALYSIDPYSTYLPDDLSKTAGWVTLNGSGPSAGDALSILNRSVSVISTYNIPDWQFETVDVTVGTMDEQADITGICAGDAKSDYDPTGTLIKSNLDLVSNDILKTSKERKINLPVKLLHAAEVGSFTFKLRFPSDKMEFVNVNSFNGSLVNNVNGDILSIAWADLTGNNPLKIEDGGTLVIISFNPIESFNFPDEIKIELLTGGEITNKFADDISATLSIPLIDFRVPETFSLYQNYPNPFNPSTVIRYDLPAESRVKLIIYNLLGEEIVQLVKGTQSAGSYEIEWDASGLRSGVYFLQLIAGDPSSTILSGIQSPGTNLIDSKKMVLIK